MEINSAILNHLIDSLTEGLILYNKEDEVEYFNQPALEIFGSALKKGIRLSQIFHPIDIHTNQLSTLSIGEAKLETDNGDIFVEFEKSAFNFEGYNLRLVKVRDVTKRVNIEKQLAESEKMLTQIIDNVPHAIFLKDHNRKFIVANEKVAEYHNKEVSYILGKSDEDLFTKEEYKPFIATENKILESKESVIIPEETFVDHEGNTRYIHSTKMPFFISSLNEWGILGVNLDITEVKRLQQEQTNLILKHQNNLMTAVVDTQERERKTIAHNLHDGLGQILTAVKMNINAFRALKSGNEEEKTEMLIKAEGLLEDAIHEVRNITGDLMPAILKDFGLVIALERLCNNMSSVTETDFYFSSMSEGFELPESTCFNLYRITQEIINNIIKHSKSAEANIQLFVRDNELILQVDDDGVGFDLEKKQQESKGLGLKSIENRVNMIDGTLDLDTGPGMGCSYTIILSLDNESEN